MNLSPVFDAIIALVATVITCILIPFVKSKLTSEQQKKLSAVIKAAVQAAEQLYKNQTGSGMLKKAYVLRILEENGYIANASEVTSKIDSFIESAVYELN